MSETVKDRGIQKLPGFRSKHKKDILSSEQVTFQALKYIANKIFPFIKFPSEVSMNSQPIPVLDTAIWIGDDEYDSPWFKSAKIRTPGEKCTMTGKTVLKTNALTVWDLHAQIKLN